MSNVVVNELEIKVQSTAAGALTSLTKVINKLDNLQKKMDSFSSQKVVSELSKINSSLGTKATQNINNLSDALKKLPANINNMSGAFTSSQASIVTATSKMHAFSLVANIVVNAAKRVFQAIKTWTSESMDYVETLNLFTVTMGEYADEAMKYAEQVESIMGINIADWMNAQAVFMALGTGFGIASEKAALMSKNLTQLGYDLSSFYNIKTADAMEKLQAGISGELEPLRRLGFDLSMAKLQEIALANGIDQRVESMTQAEKAQLRYIAIMEQSVNAQGDMARTLNAPANQLRILQANAQSAARALGNIFIPALNAILPVAIVALQAIRMVADAIASMFGFSIPEVDYSTGLGGVASGAGEAEDALDGAAGAAKKLKQAVLGIDELNVISPQDDSGGGGGAGGGGGGAYDFELPEYDFLADMVQSKIQEMMDKLLEFYDLVQSKVPETAFDYIRNSWERLKEAFSEFKEAWRGLFDDTTPRDMLAEILADMGTTVLNWVGNIMSAITGLTEGFTGIINIFDGIKDAIKDLFNGELSLESIFEGDVPQIAKGIGQSIEGAIKLALVGLDLAFLITGLTAVFQGIDWAAMLLGIDFDLSGLWIGIKDALMEVDISTLFSGVGDMFGEWITNEVSRGDILQADLLIYSFQQQMNDIFRAVFGEGFEPFGGLEDIDVGWLFERFENVFGPIRDLVITVADALREMHSAINEVLGSAAGVFATLLEAVLPLLEPLRYVLNLVWEAALSFITPVIDLLSTLGAYIIDTAQPMFEQFGSVLGIVTAYFDGLGMTIDFFATGFQISLTLVKTIFLSVTEFLTNRLSNLKDRFNAFKEFLTNRLSNLKDRFNAFKEFIAVTFQNGWLQAWTSIKNEFIRIITDMVNTGIAKINSLINAAETAVNTAINAINSFTGLSIGEIDLGNLNLVNWTGGIQTRAEGGFVNTGELFIANEAGPELVGSIGSRTAVANNDQIVAGITAGVYSAMSAALADTSNLSSDGNINITVTLDSDVVYKATEDKKRQRGYSLGMGAFAQ